MTESNEAIITSFEDQRTIRDGEQAVERYLNAEEDARREIMPMARGLLAARREYRANTAFGDWLRASTYSKIGKDDRACLIKLAENDAFAEKFIRTTRLVSPEIIWDAIRELLPSSDDPKTDPQIPSTPETDPIACAEPPAPVSVPAESDKPAQRYSVMGSASALTPIKDPDKTKLVNRHARGAPTKSARSGTFAFAPVRPPS
jgi:hypothetical protein